MRVEVGRYGGENTICYEVKNPPMATFEEITDLLTAAVKEKVLAEFEGNEDRFWHQVLGESEIQHALTELALNDFKSELIDRDCCDGNISIDNIFIEGRSGGWLCFEIGVRAPDWLCYSDEENFAQMIYENLEYYIEDFDLEYEIKESLQQLKNNIRDAIVEYLEDNYGDE